MLCSLFSFEENIFLSFLIPDTDSSTNCFLTIEGSEFYFRTIVGGVYTSKSHRDLEMHQRITVQEMDT